MRKVKFAIPLMLLAAIAVAGCRATVPVDNIENSPYGATSYADTKQLTLDDYERAIIIAGSERNWVFEKVGPGHLVGTNVVRGKHTAVVEVIFTTTEFSISYKDSKNLEYDPAKNTIHPNYNSWIELLKGDIQSEIQKLRVT
jgi:hypothetical protein